MTVNIHLEDAKPSHSTLTLDYMTEQMLKQEEIHQNEMLLLQKEMLDKLAQLSETILSVVTDAWAGVDYAGNASMGDDKYKSGVRVQARDTLYRIGDGLAMEGANTADQVTKQAVKDHLHAKFGVTPGDIG